MSQTSYIAGFLFLGFVVFITIRGELPAYKAAIFGASTSTAAAAATTSTALGALTTLPAL